MFGGFGKALGSMFGGGPKKGGISASMPQQRPMGPSGPGMGRMFGGMRPPTQSPGQPPMSFPQLPPMQPPQGEGDQQIQPVGMGEQGPPIGFASPDSMMGRGMNPRMGMMQKMMQMRRPMMPMRGGMGGGIYGQGGMRPQIQPPGQGSNQMYT